MLKTRKDKILFLTQFFPMDCEIGLEISPNIAPFFLQKQKWDVKYLDIQNTEQLRKRAKEKGIPENHVPNIDYVSHPGTRISDSVSGRSFDFIVSSHVIEHLPDLIRHFQDVSKILNPEGVYGLFVPDMNLCFDTCKSPSSLGDVIQAYVNKHESASISAFVDEYRYGVKLGGYGAWSNRDSGLFQDKYPFQESFSRIKAAIKKPSIVSNWRGHIWRFTPESFYSIYSDCYNLGLVNMELVIIKPTEKMEFICVLRKPGNIEVKDKKKVNNWNNHGRMRRF